VGSFLAAEPLVMSLIFDAELDRDDFRDRRVTIIGLGKGRMASGLARFLVACGARVTVTDAKKREDLAEGIARLGDTPVELVLGPSSDDAALADPDYVFVNQGIRPRSATILRALQRDVPVLTEMGLFFRLCPATIVGITGTKGKTTTTTLTGEILSRGPRRVVVAGNIGRAVIQELDTLTKDDIVVLELSSFQLETLGHSPHVAVITNVTEDHIDQHGTREAYVAAKRNIIGWQGPHDFAVLNLDDPTVLAMQTGAESQVRGFSLTLRPRRGAYLDRDGMLVLAEGDRPIPICAAAELRIPGRHNVANALAAAIVARIFDIPAVAIGEMVRAFEGVPLRLETVGERDGVLWVNDSASTTPSATLSALAAYDHPAVVILGGVAKGADFTELARELVLRARGAVLIGAAADEIASALDAAAPGPGAGKLEVQRASSMEDAVAKVRAIARAGDIALLSPACASFDMFSSADERGERFATLVREFTEPVKR